MICSGLARRTEISLQKTRGRSVALKLGGRRRDGFWIHQPLFGLFLHLPVLVL